MEGRDELITTKWIAGHIKGYLGPVLTSSEPWCWYCAMQRQKLKRNLSYRSDIGETKCGPVLNSASPHHVATRGPGANAGGLPSNP